MYRIEEAANTVCKWQEHWFMFIWSDQHEKTWKTFLKMKKFLFKVKNSFKAYQDTRSTWRQYCSFPWSATKSWSSISIRGNERNNRNSCLKREDFYILPNFLPVPFCAFHSRTSTNNLFLMYLQFAVNEKCVLGEYLESLIKRATSHRCTGARLSDSIIKSLKISLGGIQQGIREFIMSDVKILMYVKTRWINNFFLHRFAGMWKRNIRSNPEPRGTHRKIIS